jgi:DNA-binding SARP family transcriptional activator/ABC-type branched-subunit amino acid transport system substrate-binding protein/streptogramin lyase
VRFCILGPLEVRNGGAALELGAGRQRALLALLVLHADELVSADRLIDELWGERPPPSSAKVMQGYISQLRRVLPADTIVTREPGYLLRARETDAGEFERLLDRARGEGPREAARTLRGALALWRGPPLAGFEYEAWAQTEIARLEELRLVAVEERIEAELRLGGDRRVVPELEALVAAHPLRERLRAHLMLALYRSGRQGDALAAYAEARSGLVEQLGVEPGPELQELHHRILAHDPELGPPPIRPLARVRRRAPVLLLAGGLLLALAASTALVLLRGGGGRTNTPNSLALLDARSGRVAVQSGLGSAPSQIAIGDGGIWVLNSDDDTISQIDASGRTLLATFAVGSRPVGIAAGDGALWVGNATRTTGSQVAGTMLPSSLSEVDPAHRTVLRTIALPHSFVSDVLYGRLPGQRELVVGGGSVWVVAPDGRLLRIDAHTGRLVRRYALTADSLAFGGGDLWIDQEGTQVLRLDPRTNRVDFSYPLPAGPGIAYGLGAAWVADPAQGLVWRIQPGPQVRVRSITAPSGVTAVGVGGGEVWTASDLENEVARIDPSSNRVTSITRVNAPQDLATAAHGIWVTTGAPPPSGGPLPLSSCGPVVYPGPGQPRFIVASDLALHGASGLSARPMAAAVETLIRQHGFRTGRYTIGYQSCDDSTTQSGGFDWARCVANARAYSSDLDVIGVVGPYNSACASVEIPILDRARNGPVALVSPANTNGGLTISALYSNPGYDLYPGGARNYARVIAPEQVQYAADAELEHQLGVTHVAVLDDGDPFAAQSDRWFTYAARRLGLGTVRIGWSLSNPRSRAIAGQVHATGADGVFVAAGGLPGAAPVVAALRARLGARIPIVVTDWFFPFEQFRQLAHGNIDGVYVSNPGAPDSALTPVGRRLVARVGSSLSYTAAYGAGAAEVLLDAIARSAGTRASVTRNVFRTRIRNGILGNLSIDANGDPATAPVTIFRLRTGAHNTTGLIDAQGAVVDRVITPPPTIVAHSS